MASTNRFVVLLRAINVGGNNVAMAKLKELVESFGFTDVSTYIQTGNVIVSSHERDRKKVARVIEDGLERALKFRHAAFVLTKAELKQAAENNPFRPKSSDRQSVLLFLDAEPDKEKSEALIQQAKPEYEFAVRGKVFYYAYDKKWATKRRRINFEKSLGVTGTSRAWKVVDTLIAMAEEG